MLTLFANIVYADLSIVENEIGLDVNYGIFEEDDKVKDYVTETITLNNTDPVVVNAVISTKNLPSGYSAADVSVTVPANGLATATLTVEVPHKNDGGSKIVGAIAVSVSNVEQDSVDLVQNTKNILNLNSIEVEYITDEEDNEDDSINAEDEDELELSEKVLAGSEMTIILNLENLFEDEDYDESIIENIEIEIEADDDDLFADDFDEKYDIDEIEGDSDLDFEISFKISDDADRDYELTINIVGEDENGCEYILDEKTITFEVDRKDDDVRIKNVNTLQNTFSLCQDGQLNLEVEIQNYGKDSQKNVAVEVKSSLLGIEETNERISLDKFGRSDDKWSKTFSFLIDNKTPVGTYFVDVFAFINGDDIIDSQEVTIILEKCATEEEEKESAEDILKELLEEEEKNKTVNGTKTSTVKTSVENSYQESDYMLGFMIVGIILIATIFMLLVVILIKKK
jgi:hypothetical protein